MKLSEEKFKLAVLLKKFILDSEDLLLNVPRKDYYNRDRFRDDITDILYLVYLANNTKYKDKRLSLQEEILARLSMIDFYLERAYLYKYISEKQLYNFSSKLEVIIKVVKSWIKSNE